MLSEQKQSPVSILVVDDDATTRSMCAKLLAKNGYRVETAENGESGVDAARRLNPTLILLDLMMPDIDGYTACRRMREFTDYNETPIIMLTGLHDASSADQAFDAGANDFITKPINWPLLVKRLRYALRDREMHFRLVQNGALLRQSQRIARLAFWEIDMDANQVMLSDTFHELFDVGGRTTLPLQDFINLTHPDDRTRVETSLSALLLGHKPYRLEHKLVTKDGSTMVVQHQAEIITDVPGEVGRVLGIFQDITRQHRTEALIEYQRYYDELTGLPNKKSFFELLESTLQANASSDRLFGIALIGMDRLKKIIDSLGHYAGDTLLQLAATRLKQTVSDRADVAHFAGDTFALVTRPMHHINDINNLLQEVMDQLALPYRIQEDEMHSSASIGVSVYPIEEGTPEQLANAAQQAMNQAKNAGGNQICHHSQHMNEQIQRRHATEKKVRHALDSGGFHLFYQPQIIARTGELAGAEALIRLESSNGQWIAPLDFIPIAEESGLIIPLGYWIFDEVCRQMRVWEDSGLGGLRLGINLSALQFNDSLLTEKLIESINRHQIPAGQIDLEITESIAMSDVASTVAILNSFKQTGFTVSMDDFGTGYSSLGTLQQLPIDILKIDRSFVKDIEPDGRNGAIASAIIAMAHSLNMTVIAEGVETRGQADFLTNRECEEIQGYYYSKPLPADDFTEFCLKLSENRPRALRA